MIYFSVHVNLLYKSKRNLLRFLYPGPSPGVLQTIQASHQLKIPQSCVEPSVITGCGRNSPCRLSAPPDLSFYKGAVDWITIPKVGRASAKGHVYKYLHRWLTTASLGSPFHPSFPGLHSSFQSGSVSTNGSEVSGNAPSTKWSCTAN